MGRRKKEPELKFLLTNHYTLRAYNQEHNINLYQIADMSGNSYLVYHNQKHSYADACSCGERDCEHRSFVRKLLLHSSSSVEGHIISSEERTSLVVVEAMNNE